MKQFVSRKSRKLANKLVLAIGGGSILDKAKRYAKRNNMFVLAMPTTGSGACETSHAVVWTKNSKQNIKTKNPISIAPPCKIRLSKRVRRESTFDILGHIVDYLNVCSDNEVIELGMYAGKLIEKHPTNLTHPKSYPLTLKYGIPHGEAVGMVLCDCIKEAFKPRKKI